MTINFVHLRVHSEYSLVDSLIKIKNLPAKVAQMAMPAVAVTDDSNFFALVKFYNAALSAGVKPVFGVDIWLESVIENDEPTRMCLLVQNELGYRHVVQLISKAYRENYFQSIAVVKREWLVEKHEGIIALSCAGAGEIGKAIIRDDIEQASELTAFWQGLFGDRFYLEMQRVGREDDERIVFESAKLAAEYGVGLVATNDVRFISSDDFESHEARVCINQSRVLHDERRPKNYTPEQYMRTPEEMLELFSDYPEAIANTVEIARRCTHLLGLGKYYLPEVEKPADQSIEEFFVDESKRGLENRLAFLFDKKAEDYPKKRKEYYERLDFELGIINKMGFPSYFLIVADFIQWAKDQDIPVGPGRGSGAGSLVAYALNITDLDPIAYELLFERFLNPERVSMPDFDIDFCMDRRDEVIDYVKEKYGVDSVSQIITYGTLAARAVVKDVTRVQGKPYGMGDRLSKMVPFRPGVTLNDAYEEEVDLRAALDEGDDAENCKEIWDMALRLEGLPRNIGKHAGGVVIAPGALTDFSPLYCDENGDNLVTQFDKDDVESIGLVKFDFLGLKTLTVIDWAVKSINRRHQAAGEDIFIDIDSIPLDDRKTFELLQAAQTTAVFQLESFGMKGLIKRLKPTLLEDLIALVALYRPGPLDSGMADSFVERKHDASKIAYPHPSLQPILKETYGTLIYQEQIMQTAQELANYTLGEADMLRRAMGKKKADVMAQQKQGFCERCEANGVSGDVASSIFEDIEKFAAYCFNKSHSAAYALVSYQTAFLKAHYPAEFMAAVLTADLQNTDKVVMFIEECREIGVDVLPPSVEEGEFGFTVNSDGKIVYGLGAIKGLGEGPIEAIVEARADEPFVDFFDFCSRVEKVNKRVLESLIFSGALDCLYSQRQKSVRASLLHNLDDALKAAQQKMHNQQSGMSDLFGGDDDAATIKIPLKDKDAWSNEYRLSKEKEVLGLYLTGHPIDEYLPEIIQFTNARLNELSLEPGVRTKKVVISGLLIGMQVRMTKRGKRMCNLMLDDRSGRTEITLFEETYQQAQEFLVMDSIIVIEGDLSLDAYSDSLRVSAKKVFSFEQARIHYASRVQLLIDKNVVGEGIAQFVHQQVEPHAEEEGCYLSLWFRTPTAAAKIAITKNIRIRPDPLLIKQLRTKLGGQNVKIVYNKA